MDVQEMKLLNGLKYGGKCRDCKVDLPTGGTAWIDGKDLICEPCYAKHNPPTVPPVVPSIPLSTVTTTTVRTVRCPYCHQESTDTTLIVREFPDGTQHHIRVCASCARLREVVYRMKLDGLWPDRVPRPKSADSIAQPPVVGP